MKHMKKLLALALAVMMLLSLAITASAEETLVPFYVKITNATGHTYKIYQIFTGELSKNAAGKDVLSNIKYGDNYHPGDAKSGDEVPEDLLINFDPTSIATEGDGTLMTTTGDIALIQGLEAGYYMVKDVTENLPTGEAPSAVIFQVVENTTIASKHPKTTIVKKVQDVNDTTGEYTKDGDSTWIDSADYDFGDTVPFQSTATFDGLSNYDSYKVVFTDTMAKGLTYNGGMEVWVNNENKTSSFAISTAACADTEGAYVGGTVITVSCDNIKPLLAEGANSATIVLKYTATLNKEANIGASGNPNKIKVTTKPDGSGETPEDVNIVFTFKVEVDKYHTVNGEEVGLANAGFTLYKEVKNADTKNAKTGAAIKAELAAQNPSIKADALKNDAYYIVAAEVEVDKEGDTFGFKGIDDGNYVLVETTIPTGYNAWDDEAFTVEATHDVVSAAPALTTLTGGNLFDGTVNTGILKTEVENKPGALLPETGGIGTTIFYIAGGVMVLAAVVLLVTKKRMTTAE